MPRRISLPTRVREEAAALADERVERKLAAILAADVAGYSRLMGDDEEVTLARLKSLRAQDILQPGAGCGARWRWPADLHRDDGRECRRRDGAAAGWGTHDAYADPPSVAMRPSNAEGRGKGNWRRLAGAPADRDGSPRQTADARERTAVREVCRKMIGVGFSS